MHQEQDNIEIRSEEVQEILGTPPGWMARFGTLFALMAVVILGWIGYLIKYPDTVESQIKVTSTDPPKRLVTESRGRIKLVRVENESIVRAGEVLIVFENNASIEDVLTYETALIGASNPTDSALLNFKVPDNLMLGELKDGLFEYYRRQEEARQFVDNPYDKFSMDQLRKELRKVQSVIQSDESRWASINRQIQSVEERLQKEESLLLENLLAEERVDRTRESLLNLRRMRESIESTIRTKELDIERIRTEMGGVRADSRQDRERAIIAMRESFRNLQDELEDWRRKYVISSPIDGIVSLNMESINEQQFVKEDKEIGVVVPLQRRETQGVIRVEVAKSNRVQSGQRVIVKFDSYPFAEYGAVIGLVESKAQVPIEDKINVNVAFPQGLITTLDRRIEPSREMQGQATIITADKRLIERIFENLRSSVTQEG